ncbi:hypothetical protein [Phormidium sp. FACHB-1136]|uniref:hypothetical protein n=1 Tax=Phormidium sp. FACHB-1136 TaxID=2692848 RepID=UPI0016825F1F|nr:hypothetical protein [Phormidium sp. FACHB-1136]MBD2425425.1 hypothetical protein [Phormidium sp. FACHB-1136]
MPDYLKPISIGDRIDPPQEAEGARFTWVEDHCELMISLSGLRPAEVKGVEKGVFEFGLNVVESMPFVCFRVFEVVGAKGFGRPQRGKVVLPWHECPFHLARFHPDVLPHFDDFRTIPEARLGIIVILTDWPGMTVKALRFFTVSPFFTQKLIEALLATAPAYTFEGYEQGVQRVFHAYPVNAISDGSRVRCKSGD